MKKYAIVLVLSLAGCGGQEPFSSTGSESLEELMQRREILNKRPIGPTKDDHLRAAYDWQKLDARISVKKGYMSKKDYEDWTHEKY